MCKFQCGEIDHEEKLQQFQDFYQLNYNNQTLFLRNVCIKLVDVARRRVNEDISRRHCSFKYFIFSKKNGEVPICQKTLCNIFKITPRRIQMLQEKIKFNRSLGDKRGLHGKQRNKIADETKQLIRQHISSFPQQENHYSRQESNKQCLDPGLSEKKMWELFCIKHPDIKVTLHLYRDIFNSDFNLRFGVPRSDTCATCDRFYIQMCSSRNEEECNKIENDLKIHQMRANLAYKSLTADSGNAKEHVENIVLCVDLQQVLFCPTLTHGNIFYQRQLSCYNLAIHNQGSNKAMMFFWDETIAKRGSAEIVSCILKYVVLHFSILKTGETRKLTIWSDRCVGQNNNWRMIALMQHLVVNRYFTTMEQKFMTTGHSFLPCDRDFAMIEKAKKGKMVYIPKQWVEVIANAKTSNRFTVYLMGIDDFKDMDIILKSLVKNNFNITNHVWYQITDDDPTSLRGRPSHNILQPWNIHSLRKKTKGPQGKRLPPVKVAAFPNLYKGSLPIKAAKKKDLQAMSKFIPSEFVSFYEDLQAVED